MEKKSKWVNLIIKSIPLAAFVITLACYYLIKDSGRQKATEYPYFAYFIEGLALIYIVIFLGSLFFKKWDHHITYKAPFIAGVVLVMNLINCITTKTDFLSVVYFPSLDRIVGLLIEDRVFLLKNIIYSFKLLLTGFAWGASLGFLTGVLLGFSKVAVYWLNPVIKILGPIPTTAWIPLALSSFPTTYSANVFLIAFAVWFPVTLMTSSGIQGSSNVNFEVARTLGASTWYQIVHVGIPSAMPNIFLGIFYGTCSSFITLMSVEMNGSSSGIGWYINWQKQMMVYDGVYAGLILIAIICSTILTVLFKVRNRVLIWQKGVIKW